MKTSISNLITRIKRKADYNITDVDLDNLIVDDINSSLKLIKQWLMDAGLYNDITSGATFKTVENQNYVDLNNARIVGDVASFTAVAGDTITVTIDGTAYTTAALTGAVLVATVVTAINLATLAIGNVASESDDGYLVITSPTSGLTSSVTIANGAGTPASRLFTVSAERTQSAINDVDEVILSERVNDSVITQIDPFEFSKLYPDPTASYATTPDHFMRLADNLFFGPTPDDNVLIYMGYVFNITEVTSASTSPFSNKYDSLITALGVKAMAEYLEPDNANRVGAANKNVEFWTKQLIAGASRNIGMVRGTASRKPEIPYFAPRKV